MSSFFLSAPHFFGNGAFAAADSGDVVFLLDRHQLGRAAEELVAHYLRAQGLEILERNLRLGYLELDIVAREGSCLCVVEVRARSPSARLSALESLGAQKRRRIRWAAERLWNRRYRFDPRFERIRIDVAAVELRLEATQLEYIRNAF